MATKKEKSGRGTTAFKTLRQAAGTLLQVVRYGPGYALLIALQQITAALIPAIQVIVVADFINTAIRLASGKADMNAIMPSLIGIIATLAFSILSEKLVYFAKVGLTNRIRLEANQTFIRKYANLSYKHIEDPKAADLTARVLKTPENQYMDAYTNILACISMVVLIASNLVLIMRQFFVGGLLILLCAVPLFYLALRSGKANYQLNRETTKYVRRYNYLGEVLGGRDAVDERTLFGYTPGINTVWKEHFERARKMIFHTELIWWAKMKLGGILTALLSLIIVMALLPPVIKGSITIGMFIALINSTFSLVNKMSEELTADMDQFARNMENMADIQTFLHLSEAAGATDLPDAAVPVFEKLEFQNVRFKYPNTDKYVLNGISFVIEHGRHYSFVGANGSGKSTIIKLITGLYREFEGKILINGRSILELPQATLKALCAVAYQDFARYSLTLRENVILGDINGWYRQDADISKAIEVLNLDTVAEKLPKGVDTPLGKIDKDGVDLSGGQWQKIELARFVQNHAPLRMLDEPTAALDPISESRMYEKFDRICRHETTIFISHRLGSTKLADIIFVIDKGVVAEAGSHEQLMEQRGIYRNLYESQRSWYQCAN